MEKIINENGSGDIFFTGSNIQSKNIKTENDSKP